MKPPLCRLVSLHLVAAACALFSLTGLPVPALADTVRLYFNPAAPQISFAAGDIKSALEKAKMSVETFALSDLEKTGNGNKIVLATSEDKAALSLLPDGIKSVGSLGAQAYVLRTTAKPDMTHWVIGGDANGAMYGGFQLAENISFKGFGGSYDSKESPFLLYRGMKLNLPLDKRLPTYVGGWSSHSARAAIADVWDMTFWKTLIDQQARHRYNLLSVWVHHPFPALVRVADYPKASLPDIQKYDGSVIKMDHPQRVKFWREVMTHAHSRGMKFYFFDWNIYVDYASTQYPALSKSPDNPATIDYTSKSMKALLATYPELDGFGITTGDGMDGTREENTEWSWKAYGKPVAEYLKENPSRRFELIHRGVKTDPETVSQFYAPLKSVPGATLTFSSKYAMAHMYSTPTPQWSSDPKTVARLGMKTFLTLRNDDYFYLNWGDPQFVRDFMAGIPVKESVVGMYIGIDGYNPTRARLYKDSSLNGQLEVERRWYMEMLWARLSYNPATSDEVFKNILGLHYPGLPAKDLFTAWTLASRSLPRVTELVMKDWALDFHWYPEGCWSDPGRCSGFRTIDDKSGAKGGFAGQDVAKGSNLCNIADSAAGKCGGKKSSYQLADEMQADATKALSLIRPMRSGGNAALKTALSNVRQMACLSAYYAHKIRGATFKKAGEKIKARDEMAQAYGWWMAYSRSMEATYLPDSFRNLEIAPDWKYADAAVLKEYTDLGGKGVPEFEEAR
ncbi:hypothetical protein [Prosthecobacter vanneervenii]|uniref:Uncharacterized protein n=1 Tax=Prosthecobacter vanneervenii TaxID=48466 RepID=A0A7W7Y7J4_9BACT|nr:hypothetical protein [Prosthecobacter vanneervenii]MBB5031034.1 hypothetical protein [Prosthecobacter vanneervenii]